MSGARGFRKDQMPSALNEATKDSIRNKRKGKKQQKRSTKKNYAEAFKKDLRWMRPCGITFRLLDSSKKVPLRIESQSGPDLSPRGYPLCLGRFPGIQLGATIFFDTLGCIKQQHDSV